MLESHSILASLLLCLLVYPLLEEYIFRANLLHWLDMRLPGWRGWKTNVVVSSLFAVAHLWAWPPLHCIAVFFPSLALGWLWQRYQKLWLCVAVHATFNAIGFALNPYLVNLLR